MEFFIAQSHIIMIQRSVFIVSHQDIQLAHHLHICISKVKILISLLPFLILHVEYLLTWFSISKVLYGLFQKIFKSIIIARYIESKMVNMWRDIKWDMSAVCHVGELSEDFTHDGVPKRKKDVILGIVFFSVFQFEYFKFDVSFWFFKFAILLKPNFLSYLNRFLT